VLSGRGLCGELITRPEESYRLWCVVVCDLETSRMRRPWPALGRSATGEKIYCFHPFHHIASWSHISLYCMAVSLLVSVLLIREHVRHSVWSVNL